MMFLCIILLLVTNFICLSFGAEQVAYSQFIGFFFPPNPICIY